MGMGGGGASRSGTGSCTGRLGLITVACMRHASTSRLGKCHRALIGGLASPRAAHGGRCHRRLPELGHAVVGTSHQRGRKRRPSAHVLYAEHRRASNHTVAVRGHAANTPRQRSGARVAQLWRHRCKAHMCVPAMVCLITLVPHIPLIRLACVGHEGDVGAWWRLRYCWTQVFSGLVCRTIEDKA